MRRSGLLGIALAGCLPAGCRHSCGDHCGLTPTRSSAPTSLTAGSASCRDGVLASADRSDPNLLSPGWGYGPDSFGPSYPSGPPIPVGPGLTAPDNELPNPQRIPPQNLPGGGSAQPFPATPGAALLPAPFHSCLQVTGW